MQILKAVQAHMGQAPPAETEVPTKRQKREQPKQAAGLAPDCLVRLQHRHTAAIAHLHAREAAGLAVGEVAAMLGRVDRLMAQFSAPEAAAATNADAVDRHDVPIMDSPPPTAGRITFLRESQYEKNTSASAAELRRAPCGSDGTRLRPPTLPVAHTATRATTSRVGLHQDGRRAVVVHELS